MTLTLRTPKRAYAQGEAIDVTMRYTYTGDKPIVVADFPAWSTLSGSGHDDWSVKDSMGRRVRDPLARRVIFEDFEFSEVDLTPDQPYEQTVTLNAGFSFDRPGCYSVTLSSSRVSHKQSKRNFGAGIPLTSAPLYINILPPDEKRRQRQIALAAEVLEDHDSKTRQQALRTLGYLQDTRAIPLLVQGLKDPDTAGESEFELESFTDPAPVKAAVLQAVKADPSRVMEQDIWPYLHVLAATDEQAGSQSWEVWERFFGQRLAAALPEMPLAQTVKATVQGLASGPLLSWSDAGNWERLIDNASLISAQDRPTAAELIQSHCRVKSVIPDLERMVATLQTPDNLRAAGLAALHAMGDDSLRNLDASLKAHRGH